MPARLKINIFTPLPPASSEIANINVPVLRRLARDADVTAWAPQEFWLPLEEDGLAVRPFRADAIRLADLADADATFFHIGNNLEVHQDIYDVATKVPGVIVLHDLHLHHLMLEMYGQGRTYGYFEALERCHGAGAAETMRAAFAAGEATEAAAAFSMTLAPARAATSLLVHNTAHVAELAAESGLRVDHLDLPLDAGGEPPPPRPASKPCYRLIVFGFLGYNRRVEALLDVLATSPVRERFALDIFGRYFDERRLEGVVAALGLGDRVTIHGFVPDERLDRALAEADLAINLRHPSMGEASASQLRIWVHGTPSLVTRTEWYGTIPEDCVHFIGVDTEESDLHHALIDFCCNPGRYGAIGVNGWHHVRRRHSVARYAEGLLGIAARDRDGRRARVAADLAVRLRVPGRLMAGWADLAARWEAVSGAVAGDVLGAGGGGGAR